MLKLSVLQLTCQYHIIFPLPPVYPTLLGQSRTHGCLLLQTRRLAGEAARRSTPAAFRTKGKDGTSWVRLERELRLQEREEVTKWHRQCSSKPWVQGLSYFISSRILLSCMTLSWIYRIQEWSVGEETTQAINNWREKQQKISGLCWFNKKAWNSSLSLFKQLLKIELLKVRIFEYYCQQDMLTALILSFSPYKV